MEIMKKIMSGTCKVILFICIFLLMLSFSIDGLMENSISLIVSNSLVEVPGFEIIEVENEKVNELIKSSEAQEFIKEYVEPLIGGELDSSKIDIGGDIFTFVEANKGKIEEIIGQPIDMEKVEAFTRSEEIEKVNEHYLEIVSEASDAVPTPVKSTLHAYTYFISNNFRILMGIISGVLLFIIAFINKSYYSWIKTFGKTLIGSSIIVGVLSGLGILVMNLFFKMMEFSNVSFDYRNMLITIGISLLVGIIIVVVYKKVVKEDKSVIAE